MSTLATTNIKHPSSASNNIVLDSSARVGIGTASPAAKLHINNGTNENVHFATGGSGDQRVQALNDAGSTTVQLSIQASPLLFRGAGGTEVSRIDSSGRLLVGTSTAYDSPYGGKFQSVNTSSAIGGSIGAISNYSGDVGNAALLVYKYDNNSTTSQIFAEFVINNKLTGSGRINANGASQAAFGSYSDARLKENIADLPSQWQNFKALRPVEFDYIESQGGGHQLGFIAQEVREIFDDLVGEGRDGMLTISGFGKNESRLIKALQEAMERIEQLEQRLTDAGIN